MTQSSTSMTGATRCPPVACLKVYRRRRSEAWHQSSGTQASSTRPMACPKVAYSCLHGRRARKGQTGTQNLAGGLPRADGECAEHGPERRDRRRSPRAGPALV